MMMTSVPQQILSGANSADRSLQADFGVALSRVIRARTYEASKRSLPTKSANQALGGEMLNARAESAIEGVEITYSRRDELRAPADRSLQADFGVVLSRVVRARTYEASKRSLPTKSANQALGGEMLNARAESAIEGVEIMYSRRDELRAPADRSLQADFGVVLSRVIRARTYEASKRSLPTKSANQALGGEMLNARAESAIEGVEIMYSRRDELRALQSIHRLIESSDIGQSEVIERRATSLIVNQRSTHREDTYHRLLFLARGKGPSPNLKRSLRWSDVAMPLRGATVVIIAVAVCVVLSQLGSLGRRAALSLPSQPKSEPMVQPAMADVNSAPFAHFQPRRLVAAEAPAVSPGDAPRYRGDYGTSAVGPEERPLKPPRPNCSTQTFKVPSEAGGETSVSVVRCNGQ